MSFNIINEFEHEIDKLRVIEQMTQSNTAIRTAVDDIVPLLTELDAKLPEPYKSDLQTVLKLVNTLEGLVHATRTFAVAEQPEQHSSITLSEPIDIAQLAANSAAAEINAAAHEASAGE